MALSGLITVTEEGPRPLRLKMVRIIVAAVVALAAVVFALQPANAYEAPIAPYRPTEHRHYRQHHTHPQ